MTERPVAAPKARARWARDTLQASARPCRERFASELRSMIQAVLAAIDMVTPVVRRGSSPLRGRPLDRKSHAASFRSAPEVEEAVARIALAPGRGADAAV